MTLEPIPYAQPVQVQRNRRGLLMGFGILAICLGMLCMIWIGFAIYNAMQFNRRGYRSSSTPGEIMQLVVGIALIAVFATIYIWGGIGMIRCRRWVVPLGHALSLAWLVIGALMVETMIVEVYSLLSHPEFLLAIGIGLVLLVICPVMYLRVFKSPHVAQTLNAYDPYPVWCDHYPRSVLSIGVMCIAAAVFFLISMFSEVERCFVTFVYGGAAMAMAAGWALIFAAAAALCFVNWRAAWKVAIIGFTLYAICGVITDIRYDSGDAPLSSYNISGEYNGREYRPHFQTREIINHAVVLTICWLAGFWYLVAARGDFSGADEPGPAKFDGIS